MGEPPTVPTRTVGRAGARPRRRWVWVVAAVVAVVVAVAGGAGLAAWYSSWSHPAPRPVAAPAAPLPPPPAPATPGPSDTSGRPLPPAVVAAAARLTTALDADDLDTVESMYHPDLSAGVSPWAATASRIGPESVRQHLVEALGSPPQARSEVAYLFSSGDFGVGMERDGTVAFFGTGQGSSAASDDDSPVLGWAGWRPYTKGYGSARPSRVDAGGDGTSFVENVRWSSWGGPQAQGTGTATYVAPDAASNADGIPDQPAVVTASDLGDCHGRPGYRSVSWYFPAHPESRTEMSGYQDICEG